MKKLILNSVILGLCFSYSISGMHPDSTGSYLHSSEYDSTRINSSSFEWGKSIPKNQSIKFPYVKEEKFFNSTLSKALVGSAVILGGVSAYFKLKADKEFDSYKNNTNYKSNFNTYDTISGISFGLLQINIGILIYYFLSD
ncbi:MAG: hypothetical protein WC055_07545 [Melioribacteraceae bacterium]